ncbi:hypothetical protein [Fibrobacter sp.]
MELLNGPGVGKTRRLGEGKKKKHKMEFRETREVWLVDFVPERVYFVNV